MCPTSVTIFAYIGVFAGAAWLLLIIFAIHKGIMEMKSEDQKKERNDGMDSD